MLVYFSNRILKRTRLVPLLNFLLGTIYSVFVRFWVIGVFPALYIMDRAGRKGKRREGIYLLMS